MRIPLRRSFLAVSFPAFAAIGLTTATSAAQSPPAPAPSPTMTAPPGSTASGSPRAAPSTPPQTGTLPQTGTPSPTPSSGAPASPALLAPSGPYPAPPPAPTASAYAPTDTPAPTGTYDPTAALPPGPAGGYAVAPVAMWTAGDVAPPGYRIRHTVPYRWVIGGASLLALSYTATTLIAWGVANTGPLGAIFAPIASAPVVGGFGLAAPAALMNAGEGTVSALIALSVAQSVGLGIMIKGLRDKTPVELVPDCEPARLSITPMVGPKMGGIAIGGAL
ncbi:MAG: hypothetical protein R3F14_27785 [Polyangiaceae bacterium]